MSLTDGIVGCWSPSVRGSGYLLPDLSGRGNHGTLTNMDAGTDWPAVAIRGSHGRVLDFDGTNDRVAIGAAGVTMAPLTISAWVNVVDFSANRTYVAIHSASGSRFLLYSQHFFVTNGGAFSQATLPSTPPTNTWFHLVAIESSTSTRKIVYNAATEATATGTIVPSGINAVQIGADSSSGVAQFFQNGRIGEVAIYNRALSSAEVLDIYRQGNGAIGRQLTGQTRRRVYGFVPATGARRRRILTGMV